MTNLEPPGARQIDVVINGRHYARMVEPRTLLSDFVRHDAGLTGTKVGCEHGVCGACTIQLGDVPVRSCLLLAVQADGASIRTVESLSAPDEELHPLQAAFQEHHALQCGFCTAGILMSIEPRLRNPLVPADDEIRSMLAGNLCRCTGYQAIIDAVRHAHWRIHAPTQPSSGDHP